MISFYMRYVSSLQIFTKGKLKKFQKEIWNRNDERWNAKKRIFNLDQREFEWKIEGNFYDVQSAKEKGRKLLQSEFFEFFAFWRKIFHENILKTF